MNKRMRIVALIGASSLLIAVSESFAVPVTVTAGAQFRDIRSPNSVNWAQGDRHVLDAFVDNPVGTTVRAIQGPYDIGLLQQVDRPREFGRSQPFGMLPTTPWEFRAQNDTDTDSLFTNDITGVGALPFVRNFRIVPNGLTPTLLWDLPVGNTVTFNSVRVGLFDDRTDFRFIFPSGSVFDTLNPAATSYTFANGILEADVPYVIRVAISERLPNRFDRNRATTFKNFTPILSTGGPPVQLPTVDSAGVFNFDFDVFAGQPVILDPFVATGYEYQKGAGDPNFASLTLPDIGDNLFDLSFVDSSGALVETMIQSGVEFVFPVLGVEAFTVTGIELTARLDPLDVTAFMTTVTYVDDGTFTGTMTPITQFVPDAVPEPTTIALLSLGLAGFNFARKRIAG